MNGYVYMIVNPVGKIYVGSTKDFKKRKYHYSILSCKNQSKLYNSLLKYGFNAHTMDIIWEVDWIDMYRNERELGLHFNVMDKINGLNLKLPADTGKPLLVSKEVGFKISEKAKIRNIGSGNPFYGKKHSDEARIKMSNNAPLKTGDKNPNFGNKWTDDKKEKMRVKQKLIKRVYSEE